MSDGLVKKFERKGPLATYDLIAALDRNRTIIGAGADICAEAKSTIFAQADRIEALEQQVSDLLADVPCACGYDNPDDVCMKHYPLFRKQKARIEELEAKLARAERALSLTRRADDLRELYHKLPNDKNRIGDKRSKKSHARDAWLRAFRKAAREARTTLAELTGASHE